MVHIHFGILGFGSFKCFSWKSPGGKSSKWRGVLMSYDVMTVDLSWKEGWPVSHGNGWITQLNELEWVPCFMPDECAMCLTWWFPHASGVSNCEAWNSLGVVRVWSDMVGLSLINLSLSHAKYFRILRLRIILYVKMCMILHPEWMRVVDLIGLMDLYRWKLPCSFWQSGPENDHSELLRCSMGVYYAY
jgi:hypothetical protein